jgi:hypothetical protein
MWLKSYRGCQPSSFRARSFTYTPPMLGNIFQPRRSYSAINPAGATTGSYYDTGGTPHGFLRSGNGNFISFDPPGTLFYQQQIYPRAINPEGAITGYYETADFLFHGFLRTPNGTFTQIDPTLYSTYTQAMAINPAQAITGWYSDPSGNHGFLRARNGTLTTFDYPGSNQTFLSGIDPAGTITGSYFSNNQYHGFLRARNGSFTTFDYPGTPGSTYPFAINPGGEIAGYYTDAAGNQHGFLRIPAHQDD